MIDIGALFASITAMLEDLHMVAVNGQAADRTHEERCSIVLVLRLGVEQLERQVAAAGEVLTR